MKDLHLPFHYQGVEVMSFKQLDSLNGVPKGTTFKAFKRARERLCEGEDYLYLEPAAAAELRERGLIYAGTAHCVLLTRRGYRRLQGG